MTQKITLGYKAMMAEASAAIADVTAANAIKMQGRGDVVIVDIRDIRELEREGRIPGSFHAPRGLLEFWSIPKAPITSPSSPKTRPSSSIAPAAGAPRWPHTFCNAWG